MQRTTKRLSGRSHRHSRRTDEGLTLVEIIVAISLLGIFAITFAPILYTNLDITARQTTIAYASQQAATYIDNVRADGPSTCGNDPSELGTLPGYVADTQVISVDSRDVTVKVSGAITAGCDPAPTGPTTATMTVTACEPATGAADDARCASTDRTLATVSTQIRVWP